MNCADIKTKSKWPTQELPEGPGWSPDGGSFWVRDGITYWETGAIWKPEPGCMIRVGLGDYSGGEDYSLWSDEHRAEVLAVTEAEIARRQTEEERKNARREALREAAKQKLTEDEYDAIFDAGIILGRY